MNRYTTIFGVIVFAVLVYIAMRPQSIGVYPKSNNINREPVCIPAPFGVNANCKDESQYSCNKEYCDYAMQKIELTHSVEGKSVRLKWNRVNMKYLGSDGAYYLGIIRTDGRAQLITATLQTEFLHENPPCGRDLQYIIAVTSPSEISLDLPASILNGTTVKSVC